MRSKSIAVCSLLTVLLASLAPTASAVDAEAAPALCTIQPTWPSGYVSCSAAGVTVGCTLSTGALLLEDGLSIRCAAEPCPALDCNVSVGVPGIDVLLGTTAAAPCSVDVVEASCAAGPASCTVFANRWSYAHCETGLPCSYGTYLSMGRLSVYWNTCMIGFRLIG